MYELFKIHFGFSLKSKYYPQAIELTKLAYKHEIRGKHEDTWHIVTLTDKQMDLMATLYGIAIKLPCPKIYGADVLYTVVYCRSNKKYDYSYVSKAFKQRVLDAVEKLQKDTGKSLSDIANYLYEKYIDPINFDMQRVYEKLKQEGYIDFVEPKALQLIKASKTPQDSLLEYIEISSLISEGKYEKAIDCYYKSLNGKYFSELTSELIYLKRLANIPLAGRDLLYFRNPASINELISTNLSDYVLYIDNVLKKYKKEGHVLPLDIIVEYAPTMEQLIQKTMEEIHSGVDLIGGKFKRDFSLITTDFFGPQYNSCPQGRLFDKYPDQVKHCRVIEQKRDSKYMGLWTKYSPERHNKEIQEK